MLALKCILLKLKESVSDPVRGKVSCDTLAGRAQELCEQGGGPGFSFHVSFFAPSLINRTVSVDVKHHERRRYTGVIRRGSMTSTSPHHRKHGA